MGVRWGAADKGGAHGRFTNDHTRMSLALLPYPGIRPHRPSVLPVPDQPSSPRYPTRSIVPAACAPHASNNERSHLPLGARRLPGMHLRRLPVRSVGCTPVSGSRACQPSRGCADGPVIRACPAPHRGVQACGASGRVRADGSRVVFGRKIGSLRMGKTRCPYRAPVRAIASIANRGRTRFSLGCFHSSMGGRRRCGIPLCMRLGVMSWSGVGLRSGYGGLCLGGGRDQSRQLRPRAHYWCFFASPRTVRGRNPDHGALGDGWGLAGERPGPEHFPRCEPVVADRWVGAAGSRCGRPSLTCIACPPASPACPPACVCPSGLGPACRLRAACDLCFVPP